VQTEFQTFSNRVISSLPTHISIIFTFFSVLNENLLFFCSFEAAWGAYRVATLLNNDAEATKLMDLLKKIDPVACVHFRFSHSENVLSRFV
jgi:hypothetical protein